MKHTDNRIPLVYALHSSNLYGTERMALATLEGLRDDFRATVFAPTGPALEEAARLGLETSSFDSPVDFAWKLRPFFARNKKLAFIATGVVHSLACIGWNRIYRTCTSHLHIVHGGTDEVLSYGRKRKLNGTKTVFVAVSHFVKERLIANGVNTNQIQVIENFLSEARLASHQRRPRFNTGAKRLVVISRIDPIKRVDLLLDALDRRPELNSIPIRILGTGWELDALSRRAAERNPAVSFVGFTRDVESELAASDLLVHLCPEEPFGLAILEAMAAGVPVLVPDSGGAGSLIEDGLSGFRFQSNNAESLADRVAELLRLPAETLNRVVDAGRARLSERFSAVGRTEDYRRLLTAGLK